MKVSGRRRRTVPAARPSARPRSAAARCASVWALSHGPRTVSHGTGLGAVLVGICELFFSFLFSLRLCADSHVGGLIVRTYCLTALWHVGGGRAGGAAASLMSPPTRWGSGPGEDWG